MCDSTQFVLSSLDYAICLMIIYWDLLEPLFCICEQIEDCSMNSCEI